MLPADTNLVSEIIATSANKEHDVLTWTSQWIRRVRFSSEEPPDIEVPFSQINELLLNLDSSTEETLKPSHTLELAISELYNLCLFKIQEKSPGKVFESAVLMSNVLSEEGVTETDGKKKSRKKQYLYTPSKGLALSTLIQMYELFGDGLTSLVPLLLTTIFKNIKKLMEKDKYFHASFITSLMELYGSIVHSCGHGIISETFMTKFTKLSRTVFRELVSEDRDYPIGFLNGIISAWKCYFKQDTFINIHSGDILSGFKLKFMEGNFGAFGLDYEGTRITTAMTIADILIHYQYGKKLVSLADVMAFYTDLFLKAERRTTMSGCFESLVNFIGQSSIRDPELLTDAGYLDIVKLLTCEIFDDSMIKNQRLDCTSRNLKYLRNMHEIILPHVSISSKILILLSIFEEGSEKESLLRDEKGRVDFATIAHLQLAEILMRDLSSSFNTNEHSTLAIKTKLVQLSTSENFQIRVHANKVLKSFLKLLPLYMTEVIENALELLSTELTSSESFSFGKNHGRAFIIANLIDVADKDYVSYELIMKVIIFSTTILKDSSANTSSAAYYKELISWILLCGLMNYDDDQFLHIHSSQLFLFWKGVLTHTYSYRNEDDLYKNIEIRNHALTCLLGYLGRIEVDSEIAKQVSFLLTKCSNFNHSITIKSKTIDNVLLHNENRILQIYLKIQRHVREDFNSAVLILIVKNFTDPNLYTQPSQSSLISGKSFKEKGLFFGEGRREKQDNSPSIRELYMNGDGFAYGLSSKIYGFEIDELTIRDEKHCQSSLTERWLAGAEYWYDCFEKEINKPIASVLSYDYLVLLYGRGSYSRSEEFSPKVTTSIINSSMEIFSLVFPFLNDKIQYSVLESMNSSIFSRNTTTFRSLAIAINCCVAIYGSLKTIQQNTLTLEESVGTLLLKILKGIGSVDNAFLSKIKAECIGLLTCAVSRNRNADYVDAYLAKNSEVLIKEIVDNENPYSRVFDALSLSSIYKFNSQKLNFNVTYSVLERLVKDPHPVVHTWSLNAMAILLESLVMINDEVASSLIKLLETLLLNQDYGIYGSSTWSYNYNETFNSHQVIAQILSILTQNLGPSLIELTGETLEAFRNTLRLLTISNDAIQEIYCIDIFVNLATFKMDGVFEVEMCLPIAKRFIRDSNFIGLEKNFLISTFIEDKRLTMSAYSRNGIESSFSFLTQLLKLKVYETFIRDVELYVWTSICIFPTWRVITNYISEWFRQTCLENVWVDKLIKLFNLPQQKLFSQLSASIELYLLKQGMRKEIIEVIRDEETASIAKSDENDDNAKSIMGSAGILKNDLMPWRTRKLFIELIQELFLIGEQNVEIRRVLGRRIGALTKVCFSASTMNVQCMKQLGIEVLGMLIVIFSSQPDENQTQYSILEQEEAHIVSALMPAFDYNSSTSVLPYAIKVAAEFLSSGIVPLKRMGRVQKLMVNSLAELVDKNNVIKIGDVLVPTKVSRREIEVSVLNAWAEMTIKASSSKNAELLDFVEGYWGSLVPLWIVSLREFASYDNEERDLISSTSLVSDKKSGKRNSKLVETVWLNFVNAIGCVNSKNDKILSECLSKSDLSSFVFVLFAQCLKNIVKNSEEEVKKLRTLQALQKVLLCDVSFQAFFSNGIHEETVEIFDRLVMTESLEIVGAVNLVIEALMEGYLKENREEDQFLSGVDKLYQMLRILLSTISKLAPWLRNIEMSQNEIFKDSWTNEELDLLRRTFGIISNVVGQFPTVFKLDLYACLLFIVGKIFENEMRDTLVRMSLPLLKCVVDDSINEGENHRMVTIFFQSIKHILFGELDTDVALTTCLIISQGDLECFTGDDVNNVTKLLIAGLEKKETANVALKGFKSITNKMVESNIRKEIIRKIISSLITLSQDHSKFENFDDKQVIAEIIMGFTRCCLLSDGLDSKAALSISMPFLIWFYFNFEDHRSYVHSCFLELVEVDIGDVKFVLNSALDDDQRMKFKEIIRDGSEGSIGAASHVADQIELKRFE